MGIENGVNKRSRGLDTSLLEYQTNKLQGLISDLYNCCRDRTLFETKAFNLPQAEIKCIMLFENRRYLSNVEIAGRLEVAKSRICVILDNLEKKRIIQRNHDPNDSRVKLVRLTPTGQRKLKEIEDFSFHLHRQLLDKIPSSQRTVVISSLETLHSSMMVMKAGITT